MIVLIALAVAFVALAFGPFFYWLAIGCPHVDD